MLASFPQDWTVDTLKPKTMLARMLTSKRSFNQYQDDWKFLKEKISRYFLDLKLHLLRGGRLTTRL